MQAKHEMSNLDWPGAVEDLRGAARYLKENGVKKGEAYILYIERK